MIQAQEILQTLEAKKLSGSSILSQQLAKILNTDEEILDYISKCWGHGYVFTKNATNNWLIQEYVFVEEDWFIDYSW